MTTITITLPDELVKYMEEDPYVGDYSRFITLLIRRWQRELEQDRKEYLKDRDDPTVMWDP